MTSIAIIDYGMGNLRSVAKAFEHIAPKHKIIVTQAADAILQADRIVFPGQGAIRDCMRELDRFGLIDIVRQVAVNKPFLGLCLGPQALMDFSEENGGIAGLGIVPGEVLWFGHKLDEPDFQGKSFKIPHMGWNQVYQTLSHPLWTGIPQNSRFYFVHSYYLQPQDIGLIAGKTDYLFEFVSVIAKDNIFAVQFHPEKSARWGLQLLANFSHWNPA
jgi:glutamine amidotransferase